MKNEILSTYAETVRMAAKKARLTPRQISTASGYSYEHIRKIWQGRTPKRDNRLTISRECNDVLAEMLNIDPDRLFDLAEQEKYAQRNGYAPLMLPDPAGRKLSELWDSISDGEKEILVRMAESFAHERQPAMAARRA